MLLKPAGPSSVDGPLATRRFNGVASNDAFGGITGRCRSPAPSARLGSLRRFHRGPANGGNAAQTGRLGRPGRTAGVGSCAATQLYHRGVFFVGQIGGWQLGMLEKC
jgi:hypothetical protein